MTRVPLAVLLVLSLAVGACALGGRATPPAAPDPSRTSLELIAEAEAGGEIDADTATLYRVYSVKDSDRLPPEYRGGKPVKDGTTVLRAARSRFEQLRPEIQEQLRPYLFPPIRTKP